MYQAQGFSPIIITTKYMLLLPNYITKKERLRKVN